MKLGIIIPTYQKLNGSTPTLLKRAVESVKNQTYQDYTLIIIGDKYEDNAVEAMAGLLSTLITDDQLKVLIDSLSK